MAIDGNMTMHFVCKSKSMQQKIVEVLESIKQALDEINVDENIKIATSNDGGAYVATWKSRDWMFFTERRVLPIAMSLKKVQSPDEIFANDLFDIIKQRGIDEEDYLIELTNELGINLEWWSFHDSNVSAHHHVIVKDGKCHEKKCSVCAEANVKDGVATEEERKEVEEFDKEGKFGSVTLVRPLVEI